MAEHEARMISVRTKQAMREAKKRGVVMGNPMLSIQRNRNVSVANKQQVTAQSQWQSKIGKVIEHLEQTEELTTCKAIADALNKCSLKMVNLPLLLGFSGILLL